ncbi:hypothetical protein B0H14DRAFT_2613205 [Mycena olivaceomarginata]|nr:hypothetical protein B0H14DRAFT_2613205 [Mycena olivaceomarginata]
MAGPTHLVQVPDLEKRIHRYRSGTRGCLTPSSDAALSFKPFPLARTQRLALLPPTDSIICSPPFLGLRTNVILSTFTRTSVVSLLVVSGLILLFIVIIRSLIARHPRKRRTHWSLITPRRWRQYFAPEDRLFSIFIGGILTTTIVLNSKYCFRGAINYHCHYFETVESFPRILYPHQTIQQAGIEPDSHIYVRSPLLGGAKSSSAAMDIDSENLDDVQGLHQGSSSRQRRQTKTPRNIPKLLMQRNSMRTGSQRHARRLPNAYSGTDDSESSSVDSDSEHEVEISNEELADSLPSKTIPATSKRRKASGSKEKAPGKKRARRLPAEEDVSYAFHFTVEYVVWNIVGRGLRAIPYDGYSRG